MNTSRYSGGQIHGKRTHGEHYHNLIQPIEIADENLIESVLKVNNYGILSEEEIVRLLKEIEELCKPDLSMLEFEIEPIEFSE